MRPRKRTVTTLFVTSTHNPVLFFSNLGRVYRKKAWRFRGRPTKGRPMGTSFRWRKARPFPPCFRCRRMSPSGAACT
jgi:DNA gyrase/topoisomerase IV subunit A